MTAAKKKDEQVKAPTLNLARLIVRLKGTSPLIAHAWSEKAKKEMRDKQQKKPKGAKEIRDPEAEFMAARYIVDGKDVLPAIGFKNAAVTACTSIDGVTKVAARQTFHIDVEVVPILGPPPRLREDMVRVGMGTADLRYRPEYTDWAVDLPVTLNTNMMSVDQLVNLFNVAGFGVGVFEWRPERDGAFGRFTVESVTTL